MDKLHRNYILKVESIAGTMITITPPFTIEFDITRNVLSSSNICSIRIYNLSKTRQGEIRKDITNYTQFRKVELFAGYGQNMPKIFSGNITQAWSVREGNNMISQIECFDGGFAYNNAKSDSVVPIANTKKVDVYKALIQTLPNVTVGKIGSYTGSIGRGQAFPGSTISNLQNELGNNFFIDNGVANILNVNECLEGKIKTINSSVGLLGTPIREQYYINFDMIFEPNVICGQKISLESSTQANFNGDYKIIAIKHRGMISDSVSGEAITSLKLMRSNNLTVVN